jgi:hypothetical protein
MAWKQQHNIQYEDDTARVGKIDRHKQTLVDLEYFVRKLRNKEHDVAIFMMITKMTHDVSGRKAMHNTFSKKRVQHRWKDRWITKNALIKHMTVQCT